MSETMITLIITIGGIVVIIFTLVLASWLMQRHGNGRHMIYIGKMGIFFATSLESKDKAEDLAIAILTKKKKFNRRGGGQRNRVKLRAS